MLNGHRLATNVDGENSCVPSTHISRLLANPLHLLYDYYTPPFPQKCDAQRPCATCKRSHANQLATAMPGTDVPPEPVCTYDELPEPKEAVEKHHGEGGIRAKYERLEMRIGKLLRGEQGRRRSPCVPVSSYRVNFVLLMWILILILAGLCS
jgi:hypothetical protein